MADAPVLHVGHSSSAGFLAMRVADVAMVELSPESAAALAGELVRLVAECAQRSADELKRWVEAG